MKVIHKWHSLFYIFCGCMSASIPPIDIAGKVSTPKNLHNTISSSVKNVSAPQEPMAKSIVSPDSAPKSGILGQVAASENPLSTKQVLVPQAKQAQELPSDKKEKEVVAEPKTVVAKKEDVSLESNQAQEEQHEIIEKQVAQEVVTKVMQEVKDPDIL